VLALVLHASTAFSQAAGSFAVEQSHMPHAAPPTSPGRQRLCSSRPISRVKQASWPSVRGAGGKPSASTPWGQKTSPCASTEIPVPLSEPSVYRQAVSCSAHVPEARSGAQPEASLAPATA